MPVSRDPGDARRHRTPSRSTTRWAASATRSCSCPAPTAPPSSPLQIKVGYYTEIAGLGASPTDVVDQRQGRGLQPLPGRRRHRQLPRAGQLLAHPVQPVDQHQRRRPGRLPRLGQLLGRVPGRLDAPAQHHRRQPVADGLLHRRPAVRERRLHRRLPAAERHQRLAAAVADPQQRGRAAGPTACGTRSSPAWSAPRTTPRSRTRRTPRSRPPRSAARSRTCSSTAGAGTRSGCPPPSANTRGISWAAGPDAGPDHPAARLLRGQAGDSVQTINRAARPRQAPAAHPGRLRRRPQHRGQAPEHRGPRHRARHADRRRRRRPR